MSSFRSPNSQRRYKRKDPVTEDVRMTVLIRDRQFVKIGLGLLGWSDSDIESYLRQNPLCVVKVLDPKAEDKCGGQATLDHVKDAPMMGKRAPSDIDHLVTICSYHHIWTEWATSHRPLLRAYLEQINRGEK